ncbi:MAG: RIP metalloprotease RseP [Alphaproteobacteria bacterium]|nr:RIP metalloprotease RseP [Alphaproteobacteria bacterium]
MIEHAFGFAWNYVIIFLVILTVVVFVHEMGHYLVARWNGVRIDVFSIGFGRELFGWNDKSGTRWRVSLLPLGGYVKMFGDEDESSAGATKRELTPEEQAVSFHHKRVGQRFAIVAAGPLANFAFGILVLAALFVWAGQPMTAPVVGKVVENSAAAEAGIQLGDRIVSINGQTIRRFQDIQHIVRLRIDEPLTLVVARGDGTVTVTTRARVTETTDMFGNQHRIPVLGIGASVDQATRDVVRHGPVSALVAAVEETGTIVGSTFTALGQMIAGTRDSEELGGPLRIAKGAGQAAQMGIESVISYVILLSINLGLINLFPIPLLDGGHLAFYTVEALRGRPLSIRAQEYGFRIGLFLVFALMIFATRNDLIDLKVWDFFKGLVS